MSDNPTNTVTISVEQFTAMSDANAALAAERDAAVAVIEASVNVMRLTEGLDIYRSGDVAEVREAEQRWADAVRRYMDATSTEEAS